MANTFQQAAQRRKLIYAVLIMGLFTVSLLHRKLVIEPTAFKLQLRETARGQVDLTSSVIRHAMPGLRGISMTVLWSAAIEKQKRREYNELELVVGSITRLQPYFITPWRFQGWNLAFNVSVLCDRPADKYYYISRGLTLLAKGERRNQGAPVEAGEIPFPGNPDLRRDIAVTYQLKFGTSDDKYTMRSLLELSCIDPSKRRFEMGGLRGTTMTQDLSQNVESFCRKHPALARRIIERVLRENPKLFLQFLEDNKDIPSRYQSKDEQLFTLKDAEEQFPILPRWEGDWPNPKEEDLGLTKEAVSIYLISRTWFLYAQKPLPPSENLYDSIAAGKPPVALERTRYRKPGMTEIIFRSEPARAQAFLAEALQQEGWFDGEGWELPRQFLSKAAAGAEKKPIGTDDKYLSGLAWNKAYRMYLEYGKDNGLYFTADQRRHLEKLASDFRAKLGLKPDEMPRPVRAFDKDKGYQAFMALLASKRHIDLTSYESHLYTAQAEASQEAVQARKTFYDANKALFGVKGGTPRYLYLTEQANGMWLDVLLKYPRFAQVYSDQEETYERQLKYMTRKQKDNPEFYSECLLLAWRMSPQLVQSAPFLFTVNTACTTRENLTQADSSKGILSQADSSNIIPSRLNIRGPFDMTQYYDPTRGKDNVPLLKECLTLWSAGASLPAPPLDLLPGMLNPGRHMGMMTRCPLGGAQQSGALSSIPAPCVWFVCVLV